MGQVLMGAEQSLAEASPPEPDVQPEVPQSPRPEPDAEVVVGPCGKIFEDRGICQHWPERIGDVGPFLQLHRQGSWVVVENIASFPVGILPIITAGRFMRGEEEIPPEVLEPAETHRLAWISTGQEGYRMECYESRLPHLACPGTSKRIDPLTIKLICQPVTRDSEGWLFMHAEHGVGRPEMWIVYIDALETADQLSGYSMYSCYLKYKLTQTCTFLDHRRPAPRIFLPLQEIRFCQDSCGKTFRNGKSLEFTMKELRKGVVTIADLGIRVVAFESVYFALDNRRLKCVKAVFPPCEPVSVLLADLSDPSIKEEWGCKFTAGLRISTHEEARQMDPGPRDAKGKGKQRGRGKRKGKEGNRQ